MPRTAANKSTEVAPDAQRVVGYLYRHERRFRSRWMTLMLLGFGALWIGPIIAATLIWMLELRAGGLPDSWGYLFMWSLVIIPLLFALEWSTRGAFLDDSVGAMGGEDNMSASFSHRGLSSLALLTEISLWGPRIILASIKRLTGASRLGRNPQHPAAAILATLLARDEGMRCAAVMSRANLDADNFGDGLAYLIYHEWVDLSKDGLHLWILSEARRRVS
jgi:hypothetical protein